MVSLKVDINNLIQHYRSYYNYDYSNVELIGFDCFSMENLIQFARKKQSIFSKYAWAIIIDRIDSSLLSDELIDILCQQEIELISLGHKNLSSKNLLKIYNKENHCIEAFQSALNQDIYNNSVSLDMFKQTYCIYKDKYAFMYCLDQYFLQINDDIMTQKKVMILADYLQNNLGVEQIYDRCISYFQIKKAEDEKELHSYYSSDDLLVLISLVRNKNADTKKLYIILDRPLKYEKLSEKQMYQQIIYTIKLRQAIDK
jgi:hypothetical protein